MIYSIKCFMVIIETQLYVLSGDCTALYALDQWVDYTSLT